MTSLEDRFWLTVICAVHQTRWSGARLFSGVSLRICPCFLLLAHRWPDAWEASGCKLSARPCSGSSGAAWRMCTRTISLGTGLSCFPDHSICSSKAICPVRECPLKTVSWGLPADLVFRTRGQLAIDISTDAAADGIRPGFYCRGRGIRKLYPAARAPSRPAARRTCCGCRRTSPSRSRRAGR